MKNISCLLILISILIIQTYWRGGVGMTFAFNDNSMADRLGSFSPSPGGDSTVSEIWPVSKNYIHNQFWTGTFHITNVKIMFEIQYILYYCFERIPWAMPCQSLADDGTVMATASHPDHGQRTSLCVNEISIRSPFPSRVYGCHASSDIYPDTPKPLTIVTLTIVGIPV